MGNFNTHETERLALELYRTELAEKRENSRTELEEKRENLRTELEEKRGKERLALEQYRIERGFPSYADHPLFSVNLAKWTGLRAPYQQWIFIGSSLAIAWRGVSHMQRGYWAFQLERALHKNIGDNLRKGELLDKLKLAPADLEIPTTKLNKTITEAKATASKLVALFVLITACYVAKTRYTMQQASKRNQS